MIKVNVDKLSSQEKIDLLREILDSLPAAIKRSEIERASRIINNVSAFILEGKDGTIIKTSSVKGIISTIEDITGKKPDISNVYKVIKNNNRSIFGFKITKVFEGE